MVDPIRQFSELIQENIKGLGNDQDLRDLSLTWLRDTLKHKYSYNFSWLGRPIIQYPQDIVAIQEIIWRVQPELIIETGVAHGGSLVFSASILESIGGAGEVLGIDIEIRPHNRDAIVRHPLAKRISLLSGSSTDPVLFEAVKNKAKGKERVVVILDSNHTHSHVLEELRMYSSLVKKGSYLIVLDTVIEDLPDDAYTDRPWGRGNNPKTAIKEFLRTTDRFSVDKEIENKLLITVAPDGYLRCVKN